MIIRSGKSMEILSPTGMTFLGPTEEMWFGRSCKGFSALLHPDTHCIGSNLEEKETATIFNLWVKL